MDYRRDLPGLLDAWEAEITRLPEEERTLLLTGPDELLASTLLGIRERLQRRFEAARKGASQEAQRRFETWVRILSGELLLPEADFLDSLLW